MILPVFPFKHIFYISRHRNIPIGSTIDDKNAWTLKVFLRLF